MAFIRTVLGDIDADVLGVCYPHEHLLGRPPDADADLDFVLDDEAAAVQELARFRAAGGQVLVEMSTVDYGRDPAGLQRLAQQSGLHIIAATGFNKDTFSLPFTQDASVEALAKEMVREVQEGMGQTSIRAGVLKASSMLNAITPTAEKMLRAAAQAHQLTGAPISTHTEAGTMGLEQIQLLTEEGVDPGYIIIGHLDRKLEWPYLQEIATTGVYLGFDQIGKSKYYADDERIGMIVRLIDEGAGRQILLSGDYARRSYWKSFSGDGALGFDYILDHFMPKLRQEGIEEWQLQTLMVQNPSEALRFASI